MVITICAPGTVLTGCWSVWDGLLFKFTVSWIGVLNVEGLAKLKELVSFTGIDGVGFGAKVPVGIEVCLFGKECVVKIL